MSAMVEMVAKAICKSRTCEGSWCCQYPANMAKRSNCPVAKGAYDDAAREAIAAMREPTRDMLLSHPQAHARAWSHMIDEALK